MLSHLQRCANGTLVCGIELRRRDDLVDGKFNDDGEVLATKEILIGDVLITKLKRGGENNAN
jgi:hypothetical protein